MTSQEQAEQELAQARQDLVEQTAVVRGLEERVRFLREHAAEPGPFSEFGRTDAILAVLRSAPESLTIPQVYEGLVEAGRSIDTLRLVSATFHYLSTQGRVQRVKRGRYTASA
jgi:hypothetical protein